jgi:hypothetical protein
MKEKDTVVPEKEEGARLSLAEAHVLLSAFATEHQALAGQSLDEQQRNRLYWLKRYISELQIAIQASGANLTLPPGWWDRFAMRVQ